jgi:hypothetical protein
MPDPSGLTTTPFAALTAVAGPAILTNACSVLALGTSNRLARVVDRTRTVTREMAALEPGSAEHTGRAHQRANLAVRAHLLLRALRAVYGALGAFAASALLLVVGSALAFSQRSVAWEPVAGIALAVGAAAVVALAYGCTLMVRETRLAVQNLTEETPL